MSMTRSRVATALVCALFLAALAPAPGSYGYKGRVLDAAGKPVSGAWVEARPASRGALDAADFKAAPPQSMRTGAGGEWSVSGLGEGNWIISAVASSTPRTDAELQELARPRTEVLPAGVALTRLFRHLDPREKREMEMLDLGLAIGSAAEHPISGKLTGAFDPQHYGYQVTVTPNRAQMVGSGTTTIVMSSDSAEGQDSFAFSTVPAADGTFDFGGLDPAGNDTLEVEACLLEGPECARCSVHGTMITKIDRTGRVELPVHGAGLVHAHMTGGATRPAGQRGGTFSVSTIGGSSTSSDGGWTLSWCGEDRFNAGNTFAPDASYDMFLTAGNYLFQASSGQLASPAVLCRVDPGAKATDVQLDMKACPSFEVKLVDAQQQPLADSWVRLTPAEHAAVAPTCRFAALSRKGVLRLDHVFPGSYDAEFSLKGQEPFRMQVELKPDAPPITVVAPSQAK
jgi:hypothetical protein